jgi:hemerythrin-like metal-binding protein
LPGSFGVNESDFLTRSFIPFAKAKGRKGEMGVSNHKYDLDIRVIDRDHREISDLLVEINFNESRDGDAARRIHNLRDLARATRSHFLLEEGMMAAKKFPGLDLHRLRHQWLLQQIWQLAIYWGKEKNALTREPIGLLFESHIAHIETEDRAYGLWLRGMRRESVRDRAVDLISSAALRTGNRPVPRRGTTAWPN